MPLIMAKCTNCGGELEVDSVKEAAVCKYCGTPFITEKAVNNYNNRIEHLHADTVVLSDGQSVDDRVKAAETFINLNNYVSAEKIFSTLTQECPYDYRGWWGLIKIHTENFTVSFANTTGRFKTDFNYIKKLYNSALTVANQEEKEIITPIFNKYASYVEGKRNKLSKKINDETEQENAQFNQEKAALEAQINTIKSRQSKIRLPGNIIIILAIVAAAIYVLVMCINDANKPSGFKIFQFLIESIVCLLFAGVPSVVVLFLFNMLFSPSDRKISKLEELIKSLSATHELRIKEINEQTLE